MNRVYRLYWLEDHLLPSSSNAPSRIDASLRVTKWGTSGRGGEVDVVIKPHIPPEDRKFEVSANDMEIGIFLWIGVSYFSPPHCNSVDCLGFGLDLLEDRAAHHIAMASIVPFPVAVTFMPIFDGRGSSAFPISQFGGIS